MKRIGIILVFCALWATDGFAVSRVSGTSATVRSGATTQKVRTQTAQKTKTVRVATTTPRTASVSRSATPTKNSQRSVVKRSTAPTTAARTAVVDRIFSETRTGAEYEQCKNAYFTCMDQFCQLKNDEYRRCSCNDRITSLQEARNKLQQAGEQLTAFNENLDIVGKTAAQATAMNTASDGELALSKDNSASKALLTAIMNSIRGTDSRVENNKLSDLNSIDLSFDATNSFGTTDVGQAIASYNGQALYSAVYPQCRNAVKSSCNDASLQRAVNAYLMAIEQDCNTVQTAIFNKQKETHAAIRESSSMLDMARAENHKAHNSDDAATCLTNVENAILSEEVCGANYHKCLDNGEYIDVSTGAPIAGVVDFYKLGTLLTFNSERNNNDQKLAQNPNNKVFVINFEKRVKQFAIPALDKCVDIADEIWQDYLNKAMLDIYYAQQSKVNEIKQGCFDFVSACYMNGSTSMTNAMQGLVAAQTTTLNPNVLNLNKSLCSDYIASCNNMFDGDIVNNYIQNRHDTDSLTACRAVVQQCFDNYGGQNYENFYYPSSGLFTSGFAPDWFSLYECTDSACTPPAGQDIPNYKSECAKQLAAIEACSDPKMVEEAFGGFNYYPNSDTIYARYSYNNQNRVLRSTGIATEVYNQIMDILQTQCSNLDGKFMNVQNLALYQYNYNPSAFCEAIFYTYSAEQNQTSRYYSLYEPYSIGKSTYYFASSSLLNNIGVELGVSIQPSSGIIPGGRDPMWKRPETKRINENMCPRDYNSSVDVQSWGACLCWENGGRRSNNGTSTRCVPTFPVRSLNTYEITAVNASTYSAQQMQTYGLNNSCSSQFITGVNNDNEVTATSGFTLWPYSTTGSVTNDLPTEKDWCTGTINGDNQVCPFGVDVDNQNKCAECRTGWTTLSTCPDYYVSLAAYYCEGESTDGTLTLTTYTLPTCDQGTTTVTIPMRPTNVTICQNGTGYNVPTCGTGTTLKTIAVCYNSNAENGSQFVQTTAGTPPQCCPEGYVISELPSLPVSHSANLPVVIPTCCPAGYTIGTQRACNGSDCVIGGYCTPIGSNGFGRGVEGPQPTPVSNAIMGTNFPAGN